MSIKWPNTPWKSCNSYCKIFNVCLTIWWMPGIIGLKAQVNYKKYIYQRNDVSKYFHAIAKIIKSVFMWWYKNNEFFFLDLVFKGMPWQNIEHFFGGGGGTYRKNQEFLKWNNWILFFLFPTVCIFYFGQNMNPCLYILYFNVHLTIWWIPGIIGLKVQVN